MVTVVRKYDDNQAQASPIKLIFIFHFVNSAPPPAPHPPPRAEAVKLKSGS